MQGFGQQADETTGELLQLELETLQNEECYNRFLNVSETFQFNKGGSTGKKNKITNGIKQALYDGITDQVLCTTFTCNGTDPNLDRLAKCVSLVSNLLVYCSMYTVVAAATFIYLIFQPIILYRMLLQETVAPPYTHLVTTLHQKK